MKPAKVSATDVAEDNNSQPMNTSEDAFCNFIANEYGIDIQEEVMDFGIQYVVRHELSRFIDTSEMEE